jgi:hypothetical protein
LNGCTVKPSNIIRETTKSVPSKTGNSQLDLPVINHYAPYTGEEVSQEISKNTAFMSIIENSPASRPQSGFAEADIVYEALAEGGITRCLAIYQKEKSPKIGPVRSMRTYFIDIAYEYNLPFAHCGGSHDALDRIASEKSMSLNEMFNSSFYWRDPSIKVQEHSLYTSSDKMLELTTKKGYASEPAVKLNFDKSYWDNLNTPAANNASIRFNGSYTTSYNFKDGLYYKSMNNKPTENKEDKKPVAIKNVVIQNVKYSSRPNEPYLDAALIGSGDGYIISNGKAVRVTWSKADLKAQTIFKDETGKVVPLNPGKTWWHLLDQNAKLTIN